MDVPHGMNNITNVGSDCMVLHQFESYGTLIFMCAGWVTSSFNFSMNDEWIRPNKMNDEQNCKMSKGFT